VRSVHRRCRTLADLKRTLLQVSRWEPPRTHRLCRDRGVQRRQAGELTHRCVGTLGHHCLSSASFYPRVAEHAHLRISPELSRACRGKLAPLPRSLSPFPPPRSAPVLRRQGHGAVRPSSSPKGGPGSKSAEPSRCTRTFCGSCCRKSARDAPHIRSVRSRPTQARDSAA
jgi:hypothetical protein